jgi:hypothetical protein
LTGALKVKHKSRSRQKTLTFNGNIIRVGLNYRFGDYYAPLVTK